MLTHTLLVAVVAAVAAVGEGAQTQGFSTSGFSLAGLTGHRFQKKGTSGLFDQKIVGGTQVDIVMRPFVVSISMWTASKKSYQLQCGGSVLDKYHILAAAHCFSNKNGKMYRIRAGSTYWNKGGQVVYGSSIRVHSKYRAGKSYDYDAAVIRLATPLKIDNRTVKPVSLVKAKTAIKPDKSVTILGWGYTDPVHANPLPDKLRQVTISTIKSSECQDDYTSAFSTVTITSRMFCGMDLNGDEKNSCQGDSGGPVIDARTQQQMGIVSWAEGCAQMGSPGVYTDVANAEIRSFINQAIRA